MTANKIIIKVGQNLELLNMRSSGLHFYVTMMKLPYSAYITVCLLCLSLCTANQSINIPVEKSHVLVLVANETTTIVTPGLSVEGSRFVVIQIHSQKRELSLSSNEGFPRDSTKTGTNVGLVTLLDADQDEGTWYVKANSTHNVTVSVIVQHYTDKDPIPGGCNQIFNLELDPSVVVENDRPHRTGILFQWGNLARQQGVALPDCEDQEVLSNLKYDVYVYFMQQRDLGEDEFIRAVQKMLRPHDIVEHGTKVFSETNSPTSKSYVNVASRPGEGAVYGIQVTRKDTGQSAAYTTAVSYACDFENGTCNTSQSALRIVAAIVLGIAGFFLLFFGHRYFRATQVVFGFIFSALLTYISTSQANTEDWVALLVAVLVGAIGGGLWLAVWQRFNFPITQVFLMGLCSGYVVAAVIFFTPFGNLSWWTAPINYGLCFTCFVLLFAVSLMAFTKFLSILSCCIVGSMMVLWSVAIPLWASLEMVFMNSLFHQTEFGYQEVKVAYPLNIQDMVLYAFWPFLAVVGMGVQFWRERGHEAFSKPFETMRAHLLQHHEIPQPDAAPAGRFLYTETEDEEEQYNISSNSERTNLLPSDDSGRESYRSFQNTAAQQPLVPKKQTDGSSNA